jgi:hypothetical protein
VSEFASDPFDAAFVHVPTSAGEEGTVSELASEQFNTATCSRADERSEEGA